MKIPKVLFLTPQKPVLKYRQKRTWLSLTKAIWKKNKMGVGKGGGELLCCHLHHKEYIGAVH